MSDLSDLPLSALLVYKVLEYEGPMVAHDIYAETRAHPRSVRHGLKLLREADLVEKEPWEHDARSSVYWICAGPGVGSGDSDSAGGASDTERD